MTEEIIEEKFKNVENRLCGVEVKTEQYNVLVYKVDELSKKINILLTTVGVGIIGIVMQKLFG